MCVCETKEGNGKEIKRKDIKRDRGREVRLKRDWEKEIREREREARLKRDRK